MVQQFLMQFLGTLNRRRAYAATHPMVVSAEERLLECANALLGERDTFTLGVARDALLIDGELYATKSTYARELATKLHRRGVGAITFERRLLLAQLSDALSWLASEKDCLPFAPTRAGGVLIATIAYEHLVLNDATASAEGSVATLWCTLAALAEAGSAAPVGTTRHTGSRVGGTEVALEAAIDDAVAHESVMFVDGALTGVDREQVMSALRASMHNTAVARRTARALADMASSAGSGTAAARALLGDQLESLLTGLGRPCFASIIGSVADRTVRSAFVSNVADVLPFHAVVDWIQAAAVASEQQLSHQMIRLMTKMSALASMHSEEPLEAGFRDAARELVMSWELHDPNTDEHVALLDRIGQFARSGVSATEALTVLGTTVVESWRSVQMALELDFAGEDTAAAADALVLTGYGPELIDVISKSNGSRTASWLREIATSEKAVRQLLLTEPVDRLHARALLEMLDVGATEVLLDVLEQAQARGTRMIIRQRLAEFGSAITPQLLARLENAPWFLVRNILTLLQEGERAQASTDSQQLLRLLEHPQVQVRTEALRVLVRSEQSREAAIRHALRDENERVVLLAIQAASELADGGSPLSVGLTSQLLALVDGGDQSDPVRARAVRVVGTVVRDDTRDWLVRLTTRRTPLLRQLRLVEPTQTAATALQILQRVYANDPAVARVRALAAKASTDTRWLVRDTVPERVS